jgi:putative CocE/NonD family hydrolase
MPDGVGLETEHHAPAQSAPGPTLLMRTPYGLRGFRAVAEVFAERGYHVVLQACRGTGHSEGEFEPLVNERGDGLATLAWISAQPWFDGRLGTTGPSYLGYTQWAICDHLPAHAAMAVRVSSAEFNTVSFPGGAFHLGLWLGWIQVMVGLRRHPFLTARRMANGSIERRTWRASMKLPLVDADRRATGHAVPFWRRWTAQAIGNASFWEAMDHTHRLGARTPPVNFVSGWYDFMIDQLLRDYQSLVHAGHTPQLTIGPWFHVSAELQLEGLAQAFAWFDTKLRGEPSRLPAKPVRLHVSGRDRWLDFDSYPPAAPDTQIWQLHGGFVLSQRPTKAAPPDRYRYDPRHPTPNLGGAIFAFQGAGPVPQQQLEKRSDVLVYTSEPLFNDTTVIGNVTAVIYARASLPNADLFVRLSDVDPNGASINICDGLVRKTSADPAVPGDVWKLTLRLHATAHCFRRDHCLRLVVGSGAHPRYARNTGTDEPFGTGTTLAAVDIEIFHDPERPSAIHLPVYEV